MIITQENKSKTHGFINIYKNSKLIGCLYLGSQQPERVLD